MIDRESFKAGLVDAIRHITEPRLYQTERGYQGALLGQLSNALPALGLPDADLLVEQGYQKRFDTYGLNIRPDMAIHVPFRYGQDASRHKITS